MQKITLSIPIEVHDKNALEDKYKNLLKKAEQATYTAYAPYSKFYVGAAILLEDHTIVQGSNQENAAYPSTLCAERVAIFYVGSQYKDKKIEAIAIAAQNVSQILEQEISFLPISPCGACRQVMLEYEELQNSPIKLLIQGEHNKIYIINAISDLLPMKFSSLKNLK